MKPGAGVPAWDKTFLRLFGILVLANLVVGSLDVGRWQFADSVPRVLQAFGLAGIVAGMAIMTWCMVVNTFFAKVVYGESAFILFTTVISRYLIGITQTFL